MPASAAARLVQATGLCWSRRARHVRRRLPAAAVHHGLSSGPRALYSGWYFGPAAACRRVWAQSALPRARLGARRRSPGRCTGSRLPPGIRAGLK